MKNKYSLVVLGLLIVLAMAGCAPKPKYESAIYYGGSELPVYEHVNDTQKICEIDPMDEYLIAPKYLGWSKVASIDGKCKGYVQVDW